MAISKQEATKRAQEALEPEVSALEKKIDNWLSTRSGDWSGFDTSGISSGARREIEARYREAGWIVDYYSDQRDGSYWTFK
jgi:hypothetical protein